MRQLQLSSTNHLQINYYGIIIVFGMSLYYLILWIKAKDYTHILKTFGHLAPGESVVVHAAAGGFEAVGPGEALYQRGSLRASYFHVWLASSPAAAAALFLPEALS